MLEKRRSQRIPNEVHLQICDLYRQDASGIHHLEVPLVLTHISEHGVGFISVLFYHQNSYSSLVSFPQ